MTLYYKVGSKNEPRGKTGFAHLYEHLFFGGSANVPNFDIPLEGAGSTSTNGSTWYDRTNYVETVPTGALDLALFMESDRMGALLPAVTQDKLDKQRGVVQNEKRQGDNQPYGLAEYLTAEGLFPVGHPYRHSTIGSMADLDAATLADVQKWFTDHYGPNNVVLVLSGDIDATTARPMVEKWFGAIPRGPEVAPVAAGPVTLSAPVSREMTDQVPVLRISRDWSGPGLNDADAVALRIGMHILGGLSSSRLDNALVRGNQMAVSVRASAMVFEQSSFLNATMDVKPGVDRVAAEAELDRVMAEYIAKGPTEDEVRRAVTSVLSGEIGGLEQVGGFSGKGATLAEGEVYSGDPAKYKADLQAIAALSPATVHAALRKWLGRPVYKLAVVPGVRTEDGATMGGWGMRIPPPKGGRQIREGGENRPCSEAHGSARRARRRTGVSLDRADDLVQRHPRCARPQDRRAQARHGHRLRRRLRGRCPRYAGHAGPHARHARRGHEDAQRHSDRGGAGTARRVHPDRCQPRQQQPCRERSPPTSRRRLRSRPTCSSTRPSPPPTSSGRAGRPWPSWRRPSRPQRTCRAHPECGTLRRSSLRAAR
ncbi:M16 family metallopeptidase [Novosphingobium panipatense]|uniref:M16 family metallopeptidase n=1 Tax=Novosphingobium panipatense TaxID=428991 RepID=UPI003606D13E